MGTGEEWGWKPSSPDWPILAPSQFPATLSTPNPFPGRGLGALHPHRVQKTCLGLGLWRGKKAEQDLSGGTEQSHHRPTRSPPPKPIKDRDPLPAPPPPGAPPGTSLASHSGFSCGYSSVPRGQSLALTTVTAVQPVADNRGSGEIPWAPPVLEKSHHLLVGPSNPSSSSPSSPSSRAEWERHKPILTGSCGD